MNAFDSAVQLSRVDDETFAGELPDGWGQGQSTFGGLVLGLLAHAIGQCEPDETRRIRTLSGDLFAVLKPGKLAVTVRALRRGKSQSNFFATVEQEGNVLATASAMTSAARKGDNPVFAPEPPAPIAAETTQVLPIGPPIGPVFAQHYVFRTAAPYPFAQHSEPIAEGLVREKEPRDIWTIAAITGLLDAHWPAYYAQIPLPRPMVTVGFTAQYLMDPKAISPETMFRYRARAIAARDGFVVELRELWSEGQLVALNQQTFAILR